MSFQRKKNGKYYLCWKEKFPDQNKPGRYIWRQRTLSISKDYQTFKDFKDKFDNRASRRSLGLTDDQKEWAEFREEFLDGHKGKTRLIYADTFRRFEAIARPGRMSQFSYAQAKAWRTALEKYPSRRVKKAPQQEPTPISITTANIDIRNMHAAWEEAKRLGCVAENVFDEIKEFPTTRRLPRYLTLEEVRRLKEVARQSESPDAYPMTLIFLHTGIRLQEMINLRWASFDMERKIMFLHGSETWAPKDREENAIGLHEDVVMALKSRERASEYVFPGLQGETRDERTTTALFNRMYKRAGIQRTGCHVLRHTFATHSKLNPKVLQKVLGHSDPRTTQIYSHVTAEELQAIRSINY